MRILIITMISILSIVDLQAQRLNLDPDTLATQEQVKREVIPINKMIRYTTPDGRHVYTSGDHRYIFKGEFIDQWNGEMLGDFAKRPRIDWDYLNINIDQHVVKIYRGDNPLTIIMKPNCVECTNSLKLLVESSAAKVNGLQLFLLGNNRDDLMINRSVWCSEVPLDGVKKYLLGQDLNVSSKDKCSVAKLAQNIVLANAYGIAGLPIYVKGSGEAWVGKTVDTKQLEGLYL